MDGNRPAGKNRIVAVICNFNKKDLLRECLKSVHAMTRKPDMVVVVDNASVDGAPGMVASEFPSAVVVRLPENTGGAGGFHTGTVVAMENNADMVYLLDNDVELHPDCLAELEAALDSDPGAGAAGSKVFYHDRKEVIWQAGCTFNWLLQIKVHRGEGGKDDGRFKRMEPVDYMPATTLLVRRRAIETSGLMDPEFFVYMDDVEWCIRMRKRGWKIVYVPDSVAWHHYQSRTPNPFSIYYGTRNFLVIFARHAPKWARSPMYAFSIVKNLVKMVYCLILTHREGNADYLKVVKAFVTAYNDFFSGRLGINRDFH